MTDVTVPPSLNLGDPIEVNWTVTNQGNNSSLTAEWQDAIYLSEDEQFDIATDIFLGCSSRQG
ncbi:MAG: hypothetical protein EBE86_033480 [Hormoscilla sp. GUM202]|nr:hypothetical protein [Hormoscilla sp. GUM202]